eukprot:gene4770-5832_t
MDIFNELAQNHPNRVRKDSMRQNNIDLEYFTFSNFDDDAEQQKARILLVFGEHARELITSEVALWFGRLLAGDTSELSTWTQMHDAQMLSVKTLGETIPQNIGAHPQNIPPNIGAHPLATRLWKTTSGVDLNRNWPVAWRNYPRNAEEFGGMMPFSEAESRIVRDIALAWQPHAYTTVHSGEWALYTSWDHKPKWGERLPADTPSLLSKMDVHCECENGAAGQVSGYLAFGTSMDYFYQELLTPYPMTVEVYGPDNIGKKAKPKRQLRWHEGPALSEGDSGGKALTLLERAGDGDDPLADSPEAGRRLHQNGQAQAQRMWGRRELGCFKMFNPVTREEYRQVVADWSSAFLVLASHVADALEGGTIPLHWEVPAAQGQPAGNLNPAVARLRGGQIGHPVDHPLADGALKLGFADTSLSAVDQRWSAYHLDVKRASDEKKRAKQQAYLERRMAIEKEQREKEAAKAKAARDQAEAAEAAAAKEAAAVRREEELQLRIQEARDALRVAEGEASAMTADVAAQANEVCEPTTGELET